METTVDIFISGYTMSHSATKERTSNFTKHNNPSLWEIHIFF